MRKFEFLSVPKIVFGAGQMSRVGELAGSLGTSTFIIYNGNEGAMEELATNLSNVGLRSWKHRQKGEPTVQDIDVAIQLARGAACDVVIGLGGGSAIDAAKAVAGLLGNGGSVLDYMEVVGKGQKLMRPAAPWIAIPTTAGTGAEATKNAVITDTSQKFKASIRGEQLMARIALVDPNLSISTPAQVTAASGMDALCQCIESYTSKASNPITEGLSREGMTRAARSLRAAYVNGSDVAARADMSMAALISGIALTNAGLGAVHGFAAPIGANFPIPHGVICAALLAPVIAANIAALRLAESKYTPLIICYATVGRALSGNYWMPDIEAIDAAVACCSQLVHDLNIPRLGQFGMTEGDIPALVELAKKASSMRFNPVVLSDSALANILRCVL